MPAYYDDDDIDYMDDDIPEFQDEADFDDYLNDEESNLMNSMFPIAKEELKDYQGWDNLTLKLAIFDNEFNLDSALKEMKKRYKKKGMYYNCVHFPHFFFSTLLFLVGFSSIALIIKIFIMVTYLLTGVLLVQSMLLVNLVLFDFHDPSSGLLKV